MKENRRAGLGERIADSDGMEMADDGRVRKGGEKWEIDEEG